MWSGSRRRRRALAVLALALPMGGGCVADQAWVAADAREALVGLAAEDLMLCAGVPDRQGSWEESAFWTYDRTLGGSGFSVPVPVTGGTVNLAGGGDCRVTFQVVGGRVSRIGYSAGGEFGPARDAACAPVVRNCLRMVLEAPHPAVTPVVAPAALAPAIPVTTAPPAGATTTP
jgi:hypothetical protein